MIIGSKETFLVRALVNKLSDAGYDSSFVFADVDCVNEVWSEFNTYVYYLEMNETADSKLLIFLKDKLRAEDKQIILISDVADKDAFCDGIGREMVGKVFIRPLDIFLFTEYVEAGSFGSAFDDAKKHILIVDDDPTYMGLIRGWLNGKYKVSMANSGMQAISWLANNKADLILLDYEMPVTPGPKVMEMLRSESTTKDIPVIFLTGKSDKESVVQVLNLKPEGYILKSVTQNELIEKIAEFFSKRLK